MATEDILINDGAPFCSAVKSRTTPEQVNGIAAVQVM